MAYRFKVGDAVQCNMGGDRWATGVIVRMDYRDPSWPPERTAPYQIRLDIGGHLIYAPKDIDNYVREIVKKIPVTILTGFLGAGKTTLLNHILGSKHGLKIGIIENEFGAVSIDTSLLKEGQKRTSDEIIVEMKNGCICCTVRSDLATAFKDILKDDRELDYVIIETTGLANPAPVIQTFHLDQFTQLRFTLDAVVTVVDAKHVTKHLEAVKEDGEVNEALEQIAFADRILLNKIDLVSPQELKEVEGRLRAIKRSTSIIHTQLSKEMPDLKDFFHIDAFNIENIVKDDPDFLNEPDHEGEKTKENKHDDEHEHDKHGHGHSHSHGDEDCPDMDKCTLEHHDHQVPSHNKYVNSFVIREKGDVDMVKLNEFFTTVIQKWSSDLYRYKGILAIKGAPMKFVVQGVHMILNTAPSSDWKVGEVRENMLVFIGKNIKAHEEQIRSLFRGILANPEPLVD